MVIDCLFAVFVKFATDIEQAVDTDLVGVIALATDIKLVEVIEQIIVDKQAVLHKLLAIIIIALALKVPTNAWDHIHIQFNLFDLTFQFLDIYYKN